MTTSDSSFPPPQITMLELQNAEMVSKYEEKIKLLNEQLDAQVNYVFFLQPEFLHASICDDLSVACTVPLPCGCGLYVVARWCVVADIV